jgi:hypothetical protein
LADRVTPCAWPTDLSVAAARTIIGTTYPAADDLISCLPQRGIVREITGRKRNRIFRYQAYVSLSPDR